MRIPRYNKSQLDACKEILQSVLIINQLALEGPWALRAIQNFGCGAKQMQILHLQTDFGYDDCTVSGRRVKMITNEQ